MAVMPKARRDAGRKCFMVKTILINLRGVGGKKERREENGERQRVRKRENETHTSERSKHARQDRPMMPPTPSIPNNAVPRRMKDAADPHE